MNLQIVLFLFYINQTMYIHLLYPILLLSYLKPILSVSVHINTTSQFAFQNPIIKAQVTVLNGVEFSYILFANGTISKLDAQLNYIQNLRITNGSKIVDFAICNTNYYANNTPTIFILLEGRLCLMVITLSNRRHTLIISLASQIFHIFCEASYFNSSHGFDIRTVLYYADSMIHYSRLNTNLTILKSRDFTKHFSDSTGQIIKRVVAVKYQSKDYLISVTQNYVICSYSPSELRFVYNYSQTRISSFDELFYDKESIALVRRTGNTHFSRNTITDAPVRFNYKLNQEAAGFYLKGIRPRYDQNGQRVFIYDSKSFRINLTSSNYWNFISYVQTGLPFDSISEIGFVVFSSTNNSFLYQADSPKIISYCESLQVGKCTDGVVLPCTVKFPYCKSCDTNYTTCTQCMSSYTLINNRCVQLSTSCSVSNCIFCFLNNTCTECESNYNLSTPSSLCISASQSN